MAILTSSQYHALWHHNPIGMGSFATITGAHLPAYNDYVIRENMFEDYLDIFRGRNTRHHRPMPVGGWYYDHPFFNTDGTSKLKTKPCIKYVLIAEAPPQINPILKYIYKTTIKGGAYITAPLNAFCVTKKIINGSQIDRLVALAKEGVLFIDLFPFAIKYDEFRCDLNYYGITLDFFNNLHNVYSIENRINHIREQGLFSDDFNLPYRLNTVFIAPPKTSHFLANYVNLYLHPFLNFRMGHNTFIPLSPTIIISGYFYIGFPTGTNIVAIAPVIPNYPITVNKVPIFSCTAYSGSNTSPSSLFIKSALGLS